MNEEQRAERLRLYMNRIGELEAKIARLWAALQEITDLCKTSPADPFLADSMDRIARRALEEPKP